MWVQIWEHEVIYFSTIMIAGDNQGLDGFGLRLECQLITR